VDSEGEPRWTLAWCPVPSIRLKWCIPCWTYGTWRVTVNSGLPPGHQLERITPPHYSVTE